MAYTYYSRPVATARRRDRKRSRLSAESMYLVVVLVAGLVTAWWATDQGLWINLSAINTVASVLGINERIATTHPVGYSVSRAEDAAAAPYCEGGEQPAFANGLAALKQQVGNVMGNAIECEHAASGVGDTIQQTSTGLGAYSSQTNTASFTDGWRHWALTPDGLVTWEGTESAPPTE